MPYLAAWYLTELGLEKRSLWVTLWTEQIRRGDDYMGSPGNAPQFKSKDFRAARYWKSRGKFDVQRERFISYPGCESDENGEPVYGWAGWNHLQRAQALAALYQKRKVDEGWSADRLTPMLAGLLELVPWVKQWHNEPSAEYGGLKLGDYFESFVDGECQQLGLTRGDLTSWRPPEKKGRGKKKAKKKAAKKKSKETTEGAEV